MYHGICEKYHGTCLKALPSKKVLWWHRSKGVLLNIPLYFFTDTMVLLHKVIPWRFFITFEEYHGITIVHEA